jgi:hypothetical protein
MSSKTLGEIFAYWTGDLKTVEGEGYLQLPFNIEKFCVANDEKIKDLKQQVKEYQGFREAQTSKVRELEKEREEMKEALIDFEYCWKNPKDSDYSYYVNSKYQKLIENLKGEK